MFSSTNLFSEIPCPLNENCQIRHCLFNHDKTKQSSSRVVAEKEETARSQESESAERPLKKRRVEDISAAPAPRKVDTSLPARPPSNGTARTQTSDSKVPPNTFSKTVSPPPAKVAKSSTTATSTSPAPKAQSSLSTRKATSTETLSPRVMASSPAQFNIRYQLLKLVHEQFVRLDKELRATDDSGKDGLTLSPQQLIKEALDEEETTAKDNPKVYTNVLKLRITALKKMKVDTWKEERCKRKAQQDSEGAKRILNKKAKKLETGLSTAEEIALLPSLLTSIDELKGFGYIPKPPSPKDVSEAQAVVDSAKGWERCDRCDSRFQVFPGRREDGVLTTNGPCLYHYGKKRRPPKQPGDSAPRDDLWTCCKGEMGTKGCTKHDSHVFKVTDPKRLASIMQFEETNAPGVLPPKTAVAFDCEMAYTSLGLELVRLTATAWPSGDELVDVLVRPLGEILDLNSRFSGVWPDDLANAIPYVLHEGDDGGDGDGPSRKKRKTEDGKASSTQLHIVESPMRARELLQQHLTTTTPLIGHAIDNDLNSVRICHPSIIDTVLLYPHPQGLPFRNGLKALSKWHLDLDIQTGGDAGHDSKEDSRATGDLVRASVAQKWKEMKREGWKVDKGVFIPPQPRRK